MYTVSFHKTGTFRPKFVTEKPFRYKFQKAIKEVTYGSTSYI